MFKNKRGKITVKSIFRDEDGVHKSIAYDLDEGQLIKELKTLNERYGSLVIETITDKEIVVTSNETRRYIENENELEKIMFIIKNYISKNKT